MYWRNLIILVVLCTLMSSLAVAFGGIDDMNQNISFNDNTMNDSSKYDIDGTNNGMTFRNAKPVSFNASGSGKNYTCGSDASYLDTNYDILWTQLNFTVNFWVKFNYTTGRNIWGNQGTPNNFKLYTQDSGASTIAVAWEHLANQHYVRWEWDKATYNDTWTMITLRKNNGGAWTDWNLSINGVFQPVYNHAVDQTVGGSVPQDHWLGRANSGGSGIESCFDEYKIFNRTLEGSEIVSLYNYGNISSPAVLPFSATVKLYLKNLTSSVYKIRFDEGEFYKTYVNLSNQNGDPIENGNCSVTLPKAFRDRSSINDNFTLCTNDCDYDNYLETFDLRYNKSGTVDWVKFDVCHTNNLSNDLSINLNCETGNDSKVINKYLMPSCSVGKRTIRFNTSNCLGSTLLNVTLSNSVDNFIDSHLISNFSVARKYASYEERGTIDMFYNSSIGLYESPNELAVHYEHGGHTVYASCVNSTAPDPYNKFDFYNVKYINKAPKILFNGIENSQGFTNFNQTGPTILSDILYAQSDYIFSLIIDDDDLNSTLIIVWNKTGYFGGSFYLNTTKKVLQIPMIDYLNFRDFNDNNFTVYVSVTDTNKSTTIQQRTFKIIDPVNPYCSGLANSSVDFNTSYTWDVTCTDESFFSFNLSCDNGYNYFEDGLDVTSYDFDNETNIISNTTCQYEYCDGHTALSIDDMDARTNVRRDTLYYDNRIVIKNNDSAILSTEKNQDRYNFTVNTLDMRSYHEFTVTSPDHIYIMGNDKYKGWLITGDYWIDFENDQISFIEVKRIRANEVKVKITFGKGATSYSFRSIGKLNCITGSQFIESVPIPISPLGIFKEQVCPLEESQSKVFGWIMLFALVFIMLLFNELFFKFPFINYLIGFVFIIITIPFYSCSTWTGVLFSIFGFIIVMVEIFRTFGNPYHQ